MQLVLVVTRKPGEKIVLGQTCLVEVVAVARGVVKLALKVDQPVTLMPGRIEVGGVIEAEHQQRSIYLSRKVDDSVLLDGEGGHLIEVLIVSVKGEAVRLGIKAPRHVQVYREEVYREIHGPGLPASQHLENDSGHNAQGADRH